MSPLLLHLVNNFSCEPTGPTFTSGKVSPLVFIFTQSCTHPLLYLPDVVFFHDVSGFDLISTWHYMEAHHGKGRKNGVCRTIKKRCFSGSSDGYRRCAEISPFHWFPLLSSEMDEPTEIDNAPAITET